MLAIDKGTNVLSKFKPEVVVPSPQSTPVVELIKTESDSYPVMPEP